MSLLLAPLLCLAAVRSICAQPPCAWEGQPFLQSFTPHDYHGSVQRRGIVQDARRLVSVGNEPAVLEYDGSAWRKIPVAGRGWASGMACDAAAALVFVGAVDEPGCLKLVPGGRQAGVAGSGQGDLRVGSREHGCFRVHPTAPGQAAEIASLVDEAGPLHGEPFVLSEFKQHGTY